MNLREKIKMSKTANFLNKAKAEVLEELKNITSFLPENHGTAIRYWYIKNEKTEIVTCKCCHKEPSFNGTSKGYSKYCSVECRKEDTKKRHKINKKLKRELDQSRIKNNPDDYIKCEICGSAVKLIKNHLLNSHKDWTFDLYRQEFPNSPTIAKSTSEKNSINNIGSKNIFSKEKSTELERKQRSIFSLEYWKLKFPEKRDRELIEMRNTELKDKIKDRLLPSQIEYWTNRGFSEYEAKEKVKEKQTTFTLQKCIEKYGEEEGKKRFEERQKKWTKSLFENFEKHGDGRSIRSQWAIEVIDCICKELNIDRPKKEKWISSKNRKLRCSYDFTFNKKIIEFNGDLWHANPEIYNEDFIIPKCNLKASEKWKIDEEKIQLAESHGYEVLVIWESDYGKNPEKIIKECLNFLNS